MMDAQRMHALACEYAATRTDQALEAALQEAMPLCALIAHRFSGRGVEKEDLQQVAAMACVAALKNFDPERGLKFTTYVTPTVTGAVRNHLRDKADLLRTPRGVKEQSAALDKAQEQLLKELRREPTARELAEALGWTIARVLDVIASRNTRQIASLDNAQSDDGRTLSEQLGFMDAGFDRAETRQDLTQALGFLSDQERLLLALRFQEGMTQRQAAERLNMTQMQVLRAEKRALGTLRKEMNPSA